MQLADDLRSIYLRAVELCSPSQVLKTTSIEFPDHDLDLVCIGKCGESLFRALSSRVRMKRGFVSVPKGYESGQPLPAGTMFVQGSHPDMTEASFAAGASLADFIRSSNRPVLFVISGGSSASVEVALDPWFTPDELIHANRMMVSSGKNIRGVNTVRKHLSAIKGGRLAAMLPARSSTLIWSDVGEHEWDVVGSGPTLADATTNSHAAGLLRELHDPRCDAIASALISHDVPETAKSVPASFEVLADNRTLVEAAAIASRALGYESVIHPRQIEQSVDEAAERLLIEASHLPASAVLVAGGEPTVRVCGNGTGGRCSELALRFAFIAQKRGESFVALFGSSDGRDGNSGGAGVLTFDKEKLDESEVMKVLARSDSFTMANRIGEPLFLPQTGNNLRDLFLVARPSHAKLG